MVDRSNSERLRGLGDRLTDRWTDIAILELLLQLKQAERLKSRERRPEVDRLDGQWAQW